MRCLYLFSTTVVFGLMVIVAQNAHQLFLESQPVWEQLLAFLILSYLFGRNAERYSQTR